MSEYPKNLAVLLLAESDQAASLDRRALREAGFTRVRVMNSGIEAATLIAEMKLPLDGFYPDVAICSRQLADMDGETFCAIIRQHPQLLGFPILLLLPNESEVHQLRALGCGASALAARPYSVDFLKKKILELAQGIDGSRQLKLAAEKVDTRAFDEALATYGVLLRTERQPEDYFKVGMRCLQERRWPIAIKAFERALRDAQIKAEAELGIAAAFKGKGDMPRFKAWLARATETFIQAKRWNRARAAYARLLQHDPSARNPFLVEAHRLIHQHLYDEAAEALVQGMSLISKMKAGERYARVCMAAEDPEEMFAALSKGLEENSKGNAYLGAEIRQSLDTMIAQRQERQRQQRQEREWQLAQNLGLFPQEDKNFGSGTTVADLDKNESPNSVELREEIPTAQSKAKKNPNNVVKASNSGNVLQPLTFGTSSYAEDEEEHDDEDEDMFKKKTKLNDLLSVVKLTWKLSRRSEKKS